MFKLKHSLVFILLILAAGMMACAPATTPPPEQTTQPLSQPAAAQASPSQPAKPPQNATAVLVLETVELSPIQEIEIITVTKEGPTEEIMPITTPFPLPPSLEALVQFAKEDLTARLNVPIETIALLKFESVVWPDGSLGCPQPGMEYPQLQVEGYRILLNYQGKIYSYHGGERREPFLCAQTSALDGTPLPPPGFKE